MQSEQISIRPGNAEDAAFVYSSWLKSYLETSLFTRGVPRQLAFQNHRKIVSSILDRATVYVACPSDDDEQILGYIVAEKVGSFCVIHYAYVKAAYRRFGIAKRLMKTSKSLLHKDQKLPLMASHMTESGRYLKGAGLVYNPYLLMTGDYLESSKSEIGSINSSGNKASGRVFLVS